VIAQGDITLVTVVPPSGYAEELKAAAEAAAAAGQPLPLLPRLPGAAPAAEGAHRCSALAERPGAATWCMAPADPVALPASRLRPSPTEK